MPQTPNPDWPAYEFWSMGGTVKLLLDVDAATEARNAFQEVEQCFREMEARLTRFDSSSELSQLNRQRSMQVSTEFLNVLTTAIDYAKKTSGLFDPTLGEALQAVGYSHSFEQVVTTAFHTADVSSGTAIRGRWMDIEIDSETNTVTLPEGASLDFGGIGKGYTLNLAAEILAEYGPALVDGSGDIVAVGAPRGMEGWPVTILTPRGASRDIGRHAAFIWLRDAALATSGVDHKQWSFNGTLVHHIIDPETSAPAIVDFQTITVYAPNIVDADVYATAALAGSTSIILAEWGYLQADANSTIVINDAMQDVVSWYNERQIILMVGA